jgi:hypothetical protein
LFAVSTNQRLAEFTHARLVEKVSEQFSQAFHVVGATCRAHEDGFDPAQQGEPLAMMLAEA